MATSNGKSTSHPLSFILEGRRNLKLPGHLRPTSPPPSHHTTTPRSSSRGGGTTPRGEGEPSTASSSTMIDYEDHNSSTTKADDEAFIRRLRVHQDLQTVYTRVFSDDIGIGGQKDIHQTPGLRHVKDILIGNIRALHYDSIDAFRHEAISMLRAHCTDSATKTHDVIHQLDAIIEEMKNEMKYPVPTITDLRDDVFAQLKDLKAPTLRPPPEPEDEANDLPGGEAEGGGGSYHHGGDLMMTTTKTNHHLYRHPHRKRRKHGQGAGKRPPSPGRIKAHLARVAAGEYDDDDDDGNRRRRSFRAKGGGGSSKKGEEEEGEEEGPEASSGPIYQHAVPWLSSSSEDEAEDSSSSDDDDNGGGRKRRRRRTQTRATAARRRRSSSSTSSSAIDPPSLIVLKQPPTLFCPGPTFATPTLAEARASYANNTSTTSTATSLTQDSTASAASQSEQDDQHGRPQQQGPSSSSSSSSQQQQQQQAIPYITVEVGLPLCCRRSLKRLETAVSLVVELRYEDGEVIEQSALHLLEDPILRPGDDRWIVHVRINTLSRYHGKKNFALWLDVSQFEQREHSLCASGVLTGPIRVSAIRVQGMAAAAQQAAAGGGGGGGGGGAAGGGCGGTGEAGKERWEKGRWAGRIKKS